MRLEYSEKYKAFIFYCSYPEKDWARNAGCIWTRIVPNCWATTDPKVALKLARWASPECQAALKTALEYQKKLLELSSATEMKNIAFPVPQGHNYRDYQNVGILWQIKRLRTYIADEMGLGKTIQAIGLINAVNTINKVLVITKASLRINWVNELQEWLVRKDLTIGLAKGNSWPQTNIVVINYDILTRHKFRIDDTVWDLLVIDEAQLIKNPKAERSKMVYGAWDKKQAKRSVQPIKSKYVSALSGTPIENKPIEFFPVLRYLDPANWGNWQNYVLRFCNGHRDGFGWDVSGASNKEELQQKLRQTVMIRRLKKDVAKELPPKSYQVIEIPVDDGRLKKELAEEMDGWNRTTARGKALRQALVNAKTAGDRESFRKIMMELKEVSQVAFKEFSVSRHRTGLKKLPYAMDYLKEMFEDDPHKVLVFGHHQDILERMSKEFPYSALIYGPTPADKRQGIVDKYNKDASMLPLFGSIGAAGAGLNITSAWHVLFIEEDIVPERMSQAEDRAHRIGQTMPVLVTHLVLEGSLDAKLAHISAGKGSIIDVILGNDHSKIEFTTDGWGQDYVNEVAQAVSNVCPF